MKVSYGPFICPRGLAAMPIKTTQVKKVTAIGRDMKCNNPAMTQEKEECNGPTLLKNKAGSFI